jgi:DNA-binding GntR family transcriptional regulator
VTPLREAVRRMAALGYLILQPNRAPVVRQLGADDIREIYALRELLECFALRRGWKTIRRADLRRLDALVAKAGAATTGQKRLAARLALDAELHQLWISPERTPWLASIMERLLAYRPNLMQVLVAHGPLVDEAFDEHRRILQALKKRDVDLAVELLGHHIRKSGTVLADLTDGATAGPRHGARAGKAG